jgi:hypothetical protein
MEKYKQLQKVKEIYENGQNIIQYLKSISKNETNTIIFDVIKPLYQSSK